jgi:hypothetical protein
LGYHWRFKVKFCPETRFPYERLCTLPENGFLNDDRIEKLGFLFVLDVQDGHALVRTALWANGMGQMQGVALLALNQVNARQRVMSTSFVAAGLRMFSLRKRWHGR